MTIRCLLTSVANERVAPTVRGVHHPNLTGGTRIMAPLLVKFIYCINFCFIPHPYFSFSLHYASKNITIEKNPNKILYDFSNYLTSEWKNCKKKQDKTSRSAPPFRCIIGEKRNTERRQKEKTETGQ